MIKYFNTVSLKQSKFAKKEMKNKRKDSQTKQET